MDYYQYHGIKETQRKEKQILLGLASVKFREPVEINSGKKCTKWNLFHFAREANKICSF